MINFSRGKIELKGTEVELKADLTFIIMELYKEAGFNKDDIFECMAFAELYKKEKEVSNGYRRKNNGYKRTCKQK